MGISIKFLLSGKDKFYKRTAMALIALCFIFYGNTIKNKYALDDDMVIENNERVQKGIKGIPEIFASHYVINEKSQYDYRPIVLVTYAIEYELFGSNPHISHFINILLYAATIVLIFFLFCFLMPGQPVLPLLIALLFLIHPVHTEVVNNLKSRDELLSLFFALSALYFSLKYLQARSLKGLLMILLCFLTAVLCKITVVTFILVIPLALWFFRDASLKQSKRIVGTLLAAYAIAFVAWVLVLDESINRDFSYIENPLFNNVNFSARIPAVFYTLVYYFKLLIFPVSFAFYYGFNEITIPGWGNPVVWASAVFFIAIGIYALKKLPERDFLSFCIISFFITIGGFLNLIYPVPGIIAERLTYTPSLFFCAAMAFLMITFFKAYRVKKFFSLPQNLLVLIGIIFILSFFRVITRNRDWKDRLTLFRNDIEHVDNSVKAHSILANTIYPQLFKMENSPQKVKLVKEAMHHYTRAIEIYPQHANSLNNLSAIYSTFIGDYTKAAELAQRAIKADSTEKNAYFNLGFALYGLGKKEEAEKYYYKMLKADSAHYNTYLNLSKLYIEEKNYTKALDVNKKAFDKFPASFEINMNLANIYTTRKDTTNVLKHFELAFAANPQNKQLAIHLYKLTYSLGYIEKASFYKAKAEQLP